MGSDKWKREREQCLKTLKGGGMDTMEVILKPDYNMVNFLTVIFYQGINENNPVCQEFSHFLLLRARSRGYASEFEVAFDQCEAAHDLVAIVADLSAYVCLNDLREMYSQRAVMAGSAHSKN